MKKSAHKRQMLKYAVMQAFTQGALVISLAALVAVIIFILIRGIPHINMHLLFGDFSSKAPTIKPALVGTLYLVLISITKN